jgi:hypothetical protein
MVEGHAEPTADAGISFMQFLQVPIRGGWNPYLSLGNLEDN